MAADDRGMPIVRATGTGVPVRGNDVDTDQILPARFLKEVTFDRMGEFVFYDQRRDDDGELNDHPFNEFAGAGILVVNENFGCGSSREHAPQALVRWGINGIVGESFAEIFRDNCKSLGIPTVTADHGAVTELQDWVREHPDGTVAIERGQRPPRRRIALVRRPVGSALSFASKNRLKPVGDAAQR